MQKQNLPQVETPPRDSSKSNRFPGRVTFWFAQLPCAADPRLRRTVRCPRGKADASTDPLYRRLRVCGNGGQHSVCSARAQIHNLVDPHTFRAFKLAIPSDSPNLRRLRQRTTHLREAVIAGTTNLAQQLVVIVVFDFRFHGGSMSIGVGETVTRALE
jgi:acetyl-CoA carboxylase beta subunit